MRNLKIWRVRCLLDGGFGYIGDDVKKREAQKEYERIINIYKNVPGSVLRIYLQKKDPKRDGSYKTVKSALIW